MGGTSLTNPNRPYNYPWWTYFKGVRRFVNDEWAQTIACWLCLGHIYYDGSDRQHGCARCGAKGLIW